MAATGQIVLTPTSPSLRHAVHLGPMPRGEVEGSRERHPGELVRVLSRCAFLVDGNPVGTRAHETVRLAEGGTVEVLPPFAGG